MVGNYALRHGPPNPEHAGRALVPIVLAVLVGLTGLVALAVRADAFPADLERGIVLPNLLFWPFVLMLFPLATLVVFYGP